MVFDVLMIYISVLTMLMALCAFFVPLFFKNGYKFSWDKRVVTAIGLLFTSIFALRLFIYSQSAITPGRVLDSFLLALRTFLADGDIKVEGHFEEIENAMSELFSKKQPLWLSRCLMVTVAVDDTLAPLLTLTTVISVISQIFPKIVIKCLPFRDKFIFSEINEETVVLVESTREHFGNKVIKPMLIVTDAYVDDESEKSSELMDRLKNAGCICVKDDVLSLKVRAGKKLTYVLSDKDKMKNLSVALKLTERFSKNEKMLKWQNCIYTFTDLNEGEELLSKKCKSLEEQVKKLNEDGRSRYRMPLVIPIKEYKNIIYDLFDRLPLYTPIVGTDKKELNITIIGTGRIGKEAFLAAFWCGQMLDIKLNITAVSMDAATDFKDELNRIGESILAATEKDIPYCGVALMSCDLAKVSFDDLLSTEISSDNAKYRTETFGKCCDRLYNTDYYIVSLGSDEMNVSTAYMLRCAVERAAVDGKKSAGKSVIAVSIYDSSFKSTVAFEDENVRIYPFASFESRFSYNNVINKRFITGSQKISDTYKSFNPAYSADDMKAIYGSKKQYRYYDYWSNVARRLHHKYVMFSAGIVVEAEDELEIDSRKKAEARTRIEENIDKYVDRLRDDELCDRLAWLEHRRWNACLWSMGYRFFEGEKNFAETKVHPCLVEIVPDRHHRLPFVEGKCTLSSEDIAKSPYDDLDRVCCKYNYNCDTKKYDYPQHSDILLNDKQMRIYLDPQAKDYYSSKVNVDTYTFELYKPSISVDGQRIWEIQRYLLDENLKRQLDKVYEEQNDDVLSSILNLLQEKGKGFMTREDALKML